MKISVTFEYVQNMVLEIAQRNGIAKQEIYDDKDGQWGLCYRESLQVRFESRFSKLMESMQLYREAMAQNDAITARCALLDTELSVDWMADEFVALKKDLRKVMNMDSTEIPEGYVIPSHYEYSQK